MATLQHASELNTQLLKLRKMFEEKVFSDEARALLLQVHARLHAKEVSEGREWSYQDEVMEGISITAMRIIPDGELHSIAWLLWHLTRCEDLSMNLLVAEKEQILLAGGWLEKMSVSLRDTGNAMSPKEIIDFSDGIDIEALLAYRMAVGKETQQIISNLPKEQLHRKINPTAVQRLWDEGGVFEGTKGIADYWSKRDVAGLFLMPASRHILTHLKELQGIQHKLKRLVGKR